MPDASRPVYVSVDKDVLDPSVVATDWDQGDMREDEFFDIIGELFDTRRILAFDVCGEDLTEEPFGENKKFNEKLIGFLRSKFFE